jgi:Protein of unknown function (DUF3307)
MQLFFRAFLAVCLAHLLTDFVFQTERLVERNRRGKYLAYLLHGFIHYSTAVLITGFLIRGSIVSLRTHLVILALTVVHLLIDFCKIRCAAWQPELDGSWAFATDQILHLITVVVAARMLSPMVTGAELTAAIGILRAAPNKFLFVPVVYVAVVFGGGYFIRLLTRPLAEGVKGHNGDKPSEQLQNAGLYIGWLERFLIVTALLLQSPATIGLIITAKSIARYPEFKSERFAEYFLIGTLLSISMAVISGAILAKVLFGQVRFS